MTSQLVIFRAFLSFFSTGHFQSFFFHPLDPKSEKNSRNSINKKNSGLITLNLLIFNEILHDY